MTESETALLPLRQWRNGDLASYARICADLEVMRYLFGTMTRSAARQMERWMRHWEERGFGVWEQAEGKASGGRSTTVRGGQAWRRKHT